MYVYIYIYIVKGTKPAKKNNKLYLYSSNRLTTVRSKRQTLPNGSKQYMLRS